MPVRRPARPFRCYHATPTGAGADERSGFQRSSRRLAPRSVAPARRRGGL